MSDVKKTLFEAACEAEDGTRFKLSGVVFERREDGEGWGLYAAKSNNHARGDILVRTDFEQLPSGPKKRDVKMWVVSSEDDIKFPKDQFDECIEAANIIGRLMQWEGAQIGKPGYVIITTSRKAVYSEIQTPCDVTFQTAEQCEAAWKAECTELFRDQTNP